MTQEDILYEAEEWAYRELGSSPCEDCSKHSHGGTDCMYWNNLMHNSASDDNVYEPCEKEKQYEIKFEEKKQMYINQFGK